MSKHAIALAVLAASLAAPAGPASAAESYANCSGFIDSVPAVISTQGVWCLRTDLATAIGTGSAILVATNNVTIECNGFKLGGLGAGPTSLAHGINAVSRRNITVRNCGIRGFNHGIALTHENSGGHLVEHNRLDGVLRVGILMHGDGTSTVRHNRVRDITGHADLPNAAGILAFGHVIENTVDGVTSLDNDDVHGIMVPDWGDGYGYEIRGNRVRTLSPHGSGSILGIAVYSPRSHVLDNLVVTNTSDPTHIGIVRTGSSEGFSGRNRVSGFATPYAGSPTAAGPDYSN